MSADISFVTIPCFEFFFIFTLSTKELLEELYNKIDAKWKWALINERQIREAILSQIMLDLGKIHMTIALRDCTKKFMPKNGVYKVSRNNIEDVIHDCKLIWNNFFD